MMPSHEQFVAYLERNGWKSVSVEERPESFFKHVKHKHLVVLPPEGREDFEHMAQYAVNVIATVQNLDPEKVLHLIKMGPAEDVIQIRLLENEYPAIDVSIEILNGLRALVAYSATLETSPYKRRFQRPSNEAIELVQKSCQFAHTEHQSFAFNIRIAQPYTPDAFEQIDTLERSTIYRISRGIKALNEGKVEFVAKEYNANMLDAVIKLREVLATRQAELNFRYGEAREGPPTETFRFGDRLAHVAHLTMVALVSPKHEELTQIVGRIKRIESVDERLIWSLTQNDTKLALKVVVAMEREKKRPVQVEVVFSDEDDIKTCMTALFENRRIAVVGILHRGEGRRSLEDPEDLTML